MATSIFWEPIGLRRLLEKIRRRFIFQTSAYLTTNLPSRPASIRVQALGNDDSTTSVAIAPPPQPRPVVKTQEIVGAFLDVGDLTTDVAEIDAAVTNGLHVDYINRARAQFLADHTGAATWKALAVAPTLIVLDYRGRPVAAASS